MQLNTMDTRRIEQTIRAHKSSLDVQKRAYVLAPTSSLEASITGLEREITRLEGLLANQPHPGSYRAKAA